MKQILLTITVMAFLTAYTFSQSIPKQINYQGVLKDAKGNILTGDYTITFKIYNEASGGSALWTETQSVSITNGLFGAQLGSIKPITTVPFDRIHFLGITIGTESELTPRTLLSPSPYSFMAVNVMDNVVTSNKIQDGAITAADIGNSQVVKSINGLKDNVNLVAGPNVTLTPSGNDLTISSTGSGGGTLSGSGTISRIPIFVGETTLGNSQLYQKNSNIGIGTPTPTTKLQVVGGPISGQGLLLKMGDFPGEASKASFLTYQYSSTNWGGFGGDWDGGIWFRGVDFFFWGQGASAYPHLMMSSSGNVGIGTSTPTEKLEVAGNAKLTGSLNPVGGIVATNTITIQTTADSLVIRAGNSIITVKSNGEVNISAETLRIETMGDLDFKAANISMVAQTDFKVKSSNITMEATMDFKEKGMNVRSEASMEYKIKGLSVTSEAGVNMQVKGTMITIQSSGPNTIKGLPVMIN